MDGDGSFALPRLYSDLAWLWPLWEDLDDYRVQCDFYTRLIREHSRFEPRTLLIVGCGGGKTTHFLKQHFSVTGLDISEAMLEQAGKLNPECEFVLGDMRNFDLGKRFDAILIDDGVAYLTSREELTATFICARSHLAPGGVMLTGPDMTSDDFEQNQAYVSSVNRGEFDITFIQHYYDPDPSDTNIEALMLYLIREQGELRVERDLHIVGLFPHSLWLETLSEAGFTTLEQSYPEGTPGAQPGTTLFVCTERN